MIEPGTEGPDRDQPRSQILEGEVKIRREDDGRVVIEQAPPKARMSLGLLASADPVTVRVGGNRISLGGQVSYRVVGWDPGQSALLLERDDDGRNADRVPDSFPPGAGTKGA